MASVMDRRSGRRFPIRLEVTYRMFMRENRRIVSRGKAQTLDISRTGVLLNPRVQQPAGTAAELTIEWPPASPDDIPLQLRVVGSVVRSDERGTAVRIRRHRFERSAGGFLSARSLRADASIELVAEPCGP